jgi:hypothetical protein
MTPRYKLDGYNLDELYPTPMPRLPERARRQPSRLRERLGGDDSGRAAARALPVDRQRASSPAWTAAKVVFVGVGALAIAAVASTLPGWLIGTDAVVAGAVWFSMYRFINLWRAK